MKDLSRVSISAKEERELEILIEKIRQQVLSRCCASNLNASEKEAAVLSIQDFLTNFDVESIE